METKALKKAQPKPRVIEIPAGVHISVSGDRVTVKGPKGEVSREFKVSNVRFNVEGSKFVVSSPSTHRCHKAMTGTIWAHVKNMVAGVTAGFEYKLKVVYAHFPMTLKTEGTMLIVDNFLGEKSPRKRVLPEGVAVNVTGTDVLVTGIDKEKVGKAAGIIEQTTKLGYKDRRVFQDGIYITEKAGVKV